MSAGRRSIIAVEDGAGLVVPVAVGVEQGPREPVDRDLVISHLAELEALEVAARAPLVDVLEVRHRAGG